MNYQIFFYGIAIVSGVTTLATQGIKKIMEEFGKKPYKTTLAAIVSIVVATLTSVLYGLITQTPVNGPYIGISIILVIAGFLCATCGYDKFKEMIKEIFGGKLNGSNND